MIRGQDKRQGAERFIQTALREWVYARCYENSAQRLEHLWPWNGQHNYHRPHAGLNFECRISQQLLKAFFSVWLCEQL